MRRHTWLSLFAVSGVLVAGCSSSEGSSAVTTTPSTTEAPVAATEPTTPPTTAAEQPPAPPSTPAPEPTVPPTTAAPEPTTPPTTAAPETDEPPIPEGELELARSAFLTLDDFPEGWVETPEVDEEDPNDERFEAMMDECVGDAVNPNGDLLEAREVKTGEFASEDGSVDVTQGVVLAPTEGDALAAMAEASNEAVPGCYALATQALFEEILADPNQTTFPPGMSVGTIETELADYGYEPDVAVSYFVRIPVQIGDEQMDIYLEVWFMRHGRALSQVTFSGLGELFPQEGIDELTVTVLDRLAAIG